MPFAWPSGTSYEVTVNVKPLDTCGTISFRECALGSVQGTDPDGQLTTATLETGVLLALNMSGVTTVFGQLAGELALDALPCGETIVKMSATSSGTLFVLIEKPAFEIKIAQLVIEPLASVETLVKDAEVVFP